MPFFETIQKILDDGLDMKMTHKQRLTYNSVKDFSKYIRGGISKLKKDELLHLIKNVRSYKMDQYIINNNEIIPDDEQLKIIKAPISSNLRILAGAGTGKTTTICCRIKYLIDRGIDPRNILMLTFNVEARSVMKQRIDSLFSFPINIEVRTIDAFCYKLLQKYGYDEKLISMAEYESIARKIIDKYGQEITLQYKYVFFDEFQDINGDQFYILNSFVNSGSFLCCIGDDSQNIYQFRGSDNRYIINLNEIIKNLDTYMLCTNYRSNDKIINLANQCITHNKERIDKNMKAYTNKEGFIDLTICDLTDSENKCIIQLIKQYIEKEQIKHEQISILSRSSRRLKEIETEFEKEKIPYVSLFSDKQTKEFKQKIQEGRIVISTIHSAKGLEWKVVFIVGLRDEEFPSQMNNGIMNIEEERRLFYVALTRAKTHLHFLASRKDIPLSRFLCENKEHFEFKQCSRDKQNSLKLEKVDKYISFKNGEEILIDSLFSNENKEYYQRKFSVTELIDNIKGENIIEMRNKKLLVTNDSEEEIIFDEKIHFDESIKRGNFEADYGIFCDLYLTRELMIHNEKKLSDAYCMFILNSLHMSKDEERLFHKYNLIKYFSSNEFDKRKIISGIKVEDGPNVNTLISRLRKMINNEKIQEFLKRHNMNIDQYITMCITDFYYPTEFMKELKKSYEDFIDSKKPSRQILKSIYYVSLCQKFSFKRRRLVYRDIFSLFEKNNEMVLARIDAYIEQIKINKQVCKLIVTNSYCFEKKDNSMKLTNNVNSESRMEVVLVGELDYINNDVLVDLKCSESDMKLEWLIQLFAYYSLIVKNNCEGSGSIKKIAIINIFTGIYYEFEIPSNYNIDDFIKYMGCLIENNLNSKRNDFEIPNNLVHMITNNNNIPRNNLFVSNVHIKNTDNSNCNSDEYSDIDNETIPKNNLFCSKQSY
jgi:hypothetical protein